MATFREQFEHALKRVTECRTWLATRHSLPLELTNLCDYLASTPLDELVSSGNSDTCIPGLDLILQQTTIDLEIRLFVAITQDLLLTISGIDSDSWDEAASKSYPLGILNMDTLDNEPLSAPTLERLEFGQIIYIPCLQHLNIQSLIVDSKSNEERLSAILAGVTDRTVQSYIYSLLLNKIKQEQTLALLIWDCSSISDVAPSDIATAICLRRVANGFSVHPTIVSSYKPTIPNFDNWLGNLPHGLEQFEQLISILSESNSNDSPLDKFVKKYQVLEDLMFRRGLIDVMNDIEPHSFSLRSWKLVSEQTEDKEIPSLKSFIDHTISVSGSDVRNFVITKWNNFIGSLNSDEIGELANLLKRVTGKKISATPDQFKSNGEFPAQLANVIYKFRNSMVHHKATEFALTSVTTSVTTCKFLDQFMLPILDHICYYCITCEKAKFRYPSREIALW